MVRSAETRSYPDNQNPTISDMSAALSRSSLCTIESLYIDIGHVRQRGEIRWQTKYGCLKVPRGIHLSRVGEVAILRDSRTYKHPFASRKKFPARTSQNNIRSRVC